jgi:glycosyltransferase involved in cell wall biosynthesis
LVVVGEGPEEAALRSSAPGNVRLLGEVSDARLRWLYAHCVGLVAASREDFGLTPVEAATFGKPVAALRWGGYLDTVIPDLNGVLFDRPDPPAIAGAVDRLVERLWDDRAIANHARSFSEDEFLARIRALAS